MRLQANFLIVAEGLVIRSSVRSSLDEDRDSFACRIAVASSVVDIVRVTARLSSNVPNLLRSRATSATKVRRAHLDSHCAFALSRGRRSLALFAA